MLLVLFFKIHSTLSFRIRDERQVWCNLTKQSYPTFCNFGSISRWRLSNSVSSFICACQWSIYLTERQTLSTKSSLHSEGSSYLIIPVFIVEWMTHLKTSNVKCYLEYCIQCSILLSLLQILNTNTKINILPPDTHIYMCTLIRTLCLYIYYIHDIFFPWHSQSWLTVFSFSLLKITSVYIRILVWLRVKILILTNVLFVF